MLVEQAEGGQNIVDYIQTRAQDVSSPLVKKKREAERQIEKTRKRWGKEGKRQNAAKADDEKRPRKNLHQLMIHIATVFEADKERN